MMKEKIPVDLLVIMVDASYCNSYSWEQPIIQEALQRISHHIGRERSFLPDVDILFIEYGTEIITHEINKLSAFQFPIVKGTLRGEGLEKALEVVKRRIAAWKKDSLGELPLSRVHFLVLSSLIPFDKNAEDVKAFLGNRDLGRYSFTFLRIGEFANTPDIGMDNEFGKGKYCIKSSKHLFEFLKKFFSRITTVKVDQDSAKRKVIPQSKVKVVDKLKNLISKPLVRVGLLSLGVAVSISLVSITFFKVDLNFNKHVTEIHTDQKEQIKKKVDELKRNSDIPQSTIIDVDLETELEDDSPNALEHDVKFTYVFEDSLQNFDPGTYIINVEDRIIRAASLFQLHLEKVLATEFPEPEKITVRIQGQTDSTSITSVNYGGQFGEKMLASIEANRSIAHINLSKGQSLTSNIELGYLRAVSFWTFLRGRVDYFLENKTEYVYSVQTNDDDYGGMYRKVVIEVYIKD